MLQELKRQESGRVVDNANAYLMIGIDRLMDVNGSFMVDSCFIHGWLMLGVWFVVDKMMSAN